MELIDGEVDHDLYLVITRRKNGGKLMEYQEMIKIQEVSQRTVAQIAQKGAKKHFLKVQYFIPKLISNGTQNHFWP